MFENEIKFIADFNLNKIKSYGAFITFEKLVKSDIHPAVIQYISAELDYLVTEDRKKLLQQSIFDYSGPEVAKHFNIIAQEVKRNKKISFEDLKKLVIQAVSFNLNFIVRPNWALTKLVYNDSDQRSIEDIQLALNYVYYYDFVKNIFLSYLTKRKLTSLSITEFELILSKIDKELFVDQKQKLADYFLFTFAEFINIGGMNKTKIPPLGLELFLKEKNITDYLIRLKHEFPNETKQTIDIGEIRKIIYSSEPIKEQNKIEEELLHEQKEPIINEPDSKDDFNNSESSGTYEFKESQKEKINNDVEIKKFEDEKTSSEEKQNLLDEELKLDNLIEDDLFNVDYLKDEDKPEIEKIDLDKNIKFDETTTQNTDLNSIYDFEEETNELLKEFNNLEDEKVVGKDTEGFSSLIDDNELTSGFHTEIENFKQKEDEIDSEELNLNDEIQNFEIDYNSKRKEDILDILDERDIQRIISNVFNDDKKDFASTIERLSECGNYDEATQILKSVFITYRVNPYSKEALALTNSVAKFFTRI